MQVTPQTKLKDLKTPEDFIQAMIMIDKLVKKESDRLGRLSFFCAEVKPPKCRRNAN